MGFEGQKKLENFVLKSSETCYNIDTRYIERGLLPARFVEHVHLHEQEGFFDQKIKCTEHVLSK